jgi:hypothetical protein
MGNGGMGISFYKLVVLIGLVGCLHY